MPSRTRQAPPRASAMLEALRGLGYSTSSALADVVDNSVSAGATEVRLEFEWAGSDSHISVIDNGHGMDDSELERAMTLGARSPLETRSSNDLGRFGMGLKTASFSQCRRLTVASKKMNGQIACLRWDLDELAASAEGGWILFEGPAEGSEKCLDSLLGVQCGTIVLWEKLDRIVTPGFGVSHFGDMADEVACRLGMIFHRMIGPPDPIFRLLLNGRQVKEWDPFLNGHPAKLWHSPDAKYESPSGTIGVQCHVLPHKDRLSEEEFKIAGGPDGWISQQGFYVYRNRRLLLAGGWLGLGQGRSWNREEPHKLARLRLDIPNTADTEWKIDVKKSTARPPVEIRSWLTRLAEDTRARARRVFASRGAPTSTCGGIPVVQAWRIERLRDGVRYRIDEAHPAVSSVIEAVGDQKDLVRAMLRVVEETVPVQRIWLDTAENRDMPRTGFTAESPEAPEGIRDVLQTLFHDYTKRRGMSSESAIRLLSTTDPFQNYPSLVAALTENGAKAGDRSE